MDKNYLLKSLDITDKEQVKDLFVSVFTAQPWNDDWSDTQQLDLYLTDLMGQSNSLSYGFFDESGLIGLSLGRIKHWYIGTEYCIDEFCIKATMQRKGVGTMFIQEIGQQIKQQGIEQIYLQTDLDTPAYHFYKKNGFYETEGTVYFAKQL